MAKNATTFKKGQSGNPKGRPKIILPVRELAQQHSEAAIRILFEIMSDRPAPKSARIAAANSLLDRGHGRPRQALQIEDDRRPMSQEEITAENKRLLAEIRMFNNVPAAVHDDDGKDE